LVFEILDQPEGYRENSEMGGYDPTDLQIGTELKKRYRIEKILGHGGIHKVYIAQDSFVSSIKWILQEFYPINAFFRTPGENKVTIVTRGQKKEWIEHSMNEFLKEGLFLEELKEIKGIQACEGLA